MTFLTGIGNDLLWFGGLVLGGILAFFQIRSHYINKGEARAEAAANKHTLEAVSVAIEAERTFRGERGENIYISGDEYNADFMLGNEAISHK